MKLFYLATTITHPLDVVKVRMMNAPPMDSGGIFSCIVNVVRTAGPFGFFKGKMMQTFGI